MRDEVAAIKAEAMKQVQDEQFRARVEQEKARINARAGRTLLDKLFPFTIKIERKKNV